MMYNMPLVPLLLLLLHSGHRYRKLTKSPSNISECVNTTQAVWWVSQQFQIQWTRCTSTQVTPNRIAELVTTQYLPVRVMVCLALPETLNNSTTGRRSVHQPSAQMRNRVSPLPNDCLQKDRNMDCAACNGKPPLKLDPIQCKEAFSHDMILNLSNNTSLTSSKHAA